MRGPQPPSIDLSSDIRRELEALLRRHTTPQQIALRARIVLHAADGDNNTQIAHRLDVAVPTVRRWRERWLILQPVALTDLDVHARLTDVPRPGRPIQIADTQVCQIMRMACEAPSETGRPITEWSGREIADEAKRRNIVKQLSPRHAARLVKRGICNRTGSAAGSIALMTRSLM